MKIAHLIRLEESDHGTFGLFAIDGVHWNSLELPNRNNKSNISCIPEGEYICKTRYSPSFRKTLYMLQNVKDRSFILIHGANFAGDKRKGYQSHLAGCIALGKSKGLAKNKYGNMQKAILNSQKAIREFMNIADNKDFKLIIKDLT